MSTSDPVDPDRAAILSRRHFLIATALVGVGGCAHGGRGGAGDMSLACLSPEMTSVAERAPERLTFTPGAAELDAQGEAELERLLARLETVVDLTEIVLLAPSADVLEEPSPVAHRQAETVMARLQAAGFAASLERSPQDEGDVPPDTIVVVLYRSRP